MWSQIAPWPENIDLILSSYQKEMIETDSYLYTANNDRDDAGSDEHNRSISCPANIFTRTSRETTRAYMPRWKGGVSDFWRAKRGKKDSKNNFFAEKMKKVG